MKIKSLKLFNIKIIAKRYQNFAFCALHFEFKQ